MKNIITSLVVMVLLAAAACNKETTAPQQELLWKFTLTDNGINKDYNYRAVSFDELLQYNYPSFESSGFADPNHFELSTFFRNYQTGSGYFKFALSINSIDTLLSKRLLSTNTLQEKQKALIDIFVPGKTYEVFNQVVPFTFAYCHYITESNQNFATNIFNSLCRGSFTVTSADIWDDGTGKVKIKVSLNYNFILQAVNTSTGTWLAETRAVSGSLQTFFAIP